MRGLGEALFLCHGKPSVQEDYRSAEPSVIRRIEPRAIQRRNAEMSTAGMRKNHPFKDNLFALI
jgi:hypothetical protein